MIGRTLRAQRRRLVAAAVVVVLATAALVLTPTTTPVGASFTHTAEVTGQSVATAAIPAPPEVELVGSVRGDLFWVELTLSNPGTTARTYVVDAPYTTADGMYLVGSGLATAAPDVIGDIVRKTITVDPGSEALGILMWRPLVSGAEITYSVTEGANPPVTRVVTVP
jgi:hypothetical protein